MSALKTPIARAAHLAVGRTITARNPASVDEAWEPATVKAVRQGLKRGAPGLRVQAHFSSCDLTVWLRMGDIAEPEPEPEPEPEADEEPLATQVPSGTNVHGMQPGDEVWHVDANGENRVRAEVLRVWPQPVIRVDDLEEGTRSKTTSWDRLVPILEEAGERPADAIVGGLGRRRRRRAAGRGGGGDGGGGQRRRRRRHRRRGGRVEQRRRGRRE